MLEEVKFWYLRNHKLFGVLSNSQLKELCIITNYKKAKKGDSILFTHEKEPSIYLLKKGNLKIVETDEEGNETIKEILKQGDLFGALDLNKPDMQVDEYAKVLTEEVVICKFLLSDFENLMLKHPTLALSYTKMVGFQFRKIKNGYSNLIFKSAKERLIAFLKEWAEKEGIKKNEKVVLKNYLTQADLAQIICTTRQTVTQLLSELEKEGKILYSRKEIEIFF